MTETRLNLDHMTSKLTGFGSFYEMIHAGPRYRPTFSAQDGSAALCLAHAYNLAQQERGDPRRAHVVQE